MQFMSMLGKWSSSENLVRKTVFIITALDDYLPGFAFPFQFNRRWLFGCNMGCLVWFNNPGAWKLGDADYLVTWFGLMISEVSEAERGCGGTVR